MPGKLTPSSLSLSTYLKAFGNVLGLLAIACSYWTDKQGPTPTESRQGHMGTKAVRMVEESFPKSPLSPLCS